MLVSPSQAIVIQDTDTAFFFQLPELHQLLVEAAKLLNTEAPDLYIRQNPVPNAYTLAINGKKPFIVVHTSLVELLTRKELQVQSVFSFVNSRQLEHICRFLDSLRIISSFFFLFLLV